MRCKEAVCDHLWWCQVGTRFVALQGVLQSYVQALHRAFAGLSGSQNTKQQDEVLTMGALSEAVLRFEEIEVSPVELSLAMLRHGVSNDVPFTMKTFAAAIMKGASQQQMYSVDYIGKLKAKPKADISGDVHNDLQEWCIPEVSSPSSSRHNVLFCRPKYCSNVLFAHTTRSVSCLGCLSSGSERHYCSHSYKLLVITT